MVIVRFNYETSEDYRYKVAKLLGKTARKREWRVHFYDSAFNDRRKLTERQFVPCWWSKERGGYEYRTAQKKSKKDKAMGYHFAPHKLGTPLRR